MLNKLPAQHDRFAFVRDAELVDLIAQLDEALDVAGTLTELDGARIEPALDRAIAYLSDLRERQS